MAPGDAKFEADTQKEIDEKLEAAGWVIQDKMEWLPRTLIFAKDDDQCDRIVHAVREVFDKGIAIFKKIINKIGKHEAEKSINTFRTDPQFRIAVTVDMIATGTDIRPLECVMFMRDVKSQAYYEQMKGRVTWGICNNYDQTLNITAQSITNFLEKAA